ncbi:rolling circle replication-associated protein [Campylobacter majalis]|uniref:rolling circle replication-associated protein n=1 Tax=Campylobacter majalis TaxID=2790656 RepID=UPI003D69D623
MYGISNIDLQASQLKLDNQKSFLKNFKFINALGCERSLLDISMGANFSTKYYAEVANRVNVFSSLSVDNFLTPVFLTITLNGCFRGALVADYSKFTAKDMRFLPAYIKRKIKLNTALSIKDLINILNHQWNRFIVRYRNKYKNSNSSYIRCFEPHKKDGVPHIHALFYVPDSSIEYMKKIYKQIFNAPQNLKTNAITTEQEKNGEFNGFQTSINNPSGYVMKYIQKTFINSNKTDKLDDLSAWYVKHKVRRFLSSKTQVPLWVYRKINFISTFQDFYNLNELKNDNRVVIEWNKQDDYISIDIPFLKEQVIYLNGRLEHYRANRLINIYDKEKPNFTNSLSSNRIDFNQINKNLKEIKEQKEKRLSTKSNIPLSKMKDFKLYNYYNELDKDSANIQHLAYVENLILERNMGNLIHIDKKHDLNDKDKIYTNLSYRKVIYNAFV